MLDVLVELVNQRKGSDLDRAPELPDMPWTMRLNRQHIPVDVEELAGSYWEKRDLSKAEAAFSLLVNAFENYAEGHNYLGLIALERRQLTDAISHFRKTVEVGRRLFPKRMEEAARHFAHGTLNHPRAAQLIFGKKRLARPQGFSEIEDHNTGVALLENLDHFLSRPNRAAMSYFRELLDSEKVASSVEERLRAEREWSVLRSGDRRDFDTMQRMKSLEFASSLMTNP